MAFSSSARSAAAISDDDPAGLTVQAQISPLVARGRRDLLDRIGDFMMRHALEISSVNIAAVCGALSGANAPLGKAIAEREIGGQPIDQRWLDTVLRLDPETGARTEELEKLMDRFEYSLIRFGQTARSAAAEASDQRAGIDAEIAAMGGGDDVNDGGDAAPQMAQVIALSRSVLERVAAIESAMQQSQAETTQLRESLAKARAEADIDHLTGLPNRRAFERQLSSASLRAREEGEQVCIAFCDIDNFKIVNDRHGHDAGDRVLCALASVLNEAASHECFVARHGGEEFALLFHGVDIEAAFSRLDLMRRTMACRQLVNRDTGKPFGKVTFSAGLAEFDGEQDTRAVLARADAALYRAKQEGRNRIVSD